MYYVYLIQNSFSKEKYIGYTNNLIRRIREHNNRQNKSTNSEMGIWELKYYEAYVSMEDAFLREKRLKQHGRSKQEFI